MRRRLSPEAPPFFMGVPPLRGAPCRASPGPQLTPALASAKGGIIPYATHSAASRRTTGGSASRHAYPSSASGPAP